MPLLIWWSGREDSNLRPQRPERCALTGLRHSPPRREAYTGEQVLVMLRPSVKGIKSVLTLWKAYVHHVW